MPEPKAAERVMEPHDLLVATAMLTRFPTPVDHARAGARLGRAAWAYPAVGAAIGLLGAGVYALLVGLNAPSEASAAAALAVGVVATGGLHEDGLADTADGLGAEGDRSRALEILRDSRLGAYGAIALILALLIRWSALSSFDVATALWALPAAEAASRAVMVGVMRWTPPARPDGLGATAGAPPPSAVAAAAALTGLLLLAAAAAGAGVAAGVAGAAAAAAAWGGARLALIRFGGRTGDVLGACQQLALIASLLVFSAVA